ncbi:MAG: glutamine--fructose-6-phosphate transaminase (isomerizing) [bacterium]
MCGIVGYIGNKPVIPVLIEGLSKLEYRGYDSAGIAVFHENCIKTFKESGKLENLRTAVEFSNELKEANTIGIGHIRWATHGAPTRTNAHPHISCCEKIAIVHNGIIENYKELKEDLISKGHEFVSQTDTEVLVHLLEESLKEHGTAHAAIQDTLKKVIGAFALGIIFAEEPETLYAARKSAPLIVGVGENENFIASDVPALLEYTKKIIYLDDGEIAILKKDGVNVYDFNQNKIAKKVETLPWEPVAISKMGYKHFMLKEIHEQPDVIRQTLSGRLISTDQPIRLDEVKLNNYHLKNLERIQVIACGTSLHAALVGKHLIEDLIGIPVDVEASSEYIYRRTITNDKSLVIGVSQSGETADTLTGIRQAKEKGSHVLIITNRVDSTMAREADSLLPINAGIEVSVAATKSFTAQLLAFYLLAIHLAEVKGTISEHDALRYKEELVQLPQKVETILLKKDEIKRCAKHFHNTRDFIYIARGINFPVALEGALKLKEISYINATGYPAGELKHGPIAMLDEDLPVLSILMPGGVYDKVLSNSEEAKARDAKMIAVTSDNNPHLNDIFEFIIKVPTIDETFSPIITNIPLQLLAYYIAEFLGKDVDQPRNLAKSVTVE